MMKLGIISLEDFEKIDRVLLKKYNLTFISPPFCIKIILSYFLDFLNAIFVAAVHTG